jgi:PhnB protein
VEFHLSRLSDALNLGARTRQRMWAQIHDQLGMTVEDFDLLKLRPYADNLPLLVVHDTSDRYWPYENSARLVQTMATSQDAHHRGARSQPASRRWPGGRCRRRLRRGGLVSCQWSPLVFRRSIQHTWKEPVVASRLNPYLNFRDNAREAMEFYRDVFGGKLDMNTFGEYGDPDAPGANGIMHAQLETDNGFTLMASDAPPGTESSQGGGQITISLSGDDEQELRGYWDKLSDGGSVTMPLEKQMWGDVFGMCTDKFGVPWMIDIYQPQG